MECSTVEYGSDGYDCDYDFYIPLCQKIRTARKNQDCYECWRVIPKGQKYESYQGIHQKKVFTHKTCLDCLSVRKEFFTEGVQLGGVWEYVDEHIKACGYEISEAAIARLTTNAQAKICDQIQDSWGEEMSENQEELIEMVLDCNKRSARMTGWEQDFCQSIHSQLTKGMVLTTKQAGTLEKIWDLATLTG